MKISHQFLKNQWNRIIYGVILFTPLLTSLPLYSQGLYESFSDISLIQKENYKKKINLVSKKRFEIKDVDKIDDIKIDSDFITNILFHTPLRYSQLGLNDRCSLYDILNTRLLKGANGEISDILFSYTNKSGNLTQRILKKKAFFDLIVSKQCPGVIKLSKYFSPVNIKKTLRSLKLETPKNIQQCEKILSEFNNDYKTPYLCQIHEDIKSLRPNQRKLSSLKKNNYNKYLKTKANITRTTRLEKLLNYKSKSYIAKLCKNLHSKEKFCKSFFDHNFWTNIQFTKNEYILPTYCHKLRGKKKISKSLFNNCVAFLTKDTQACYLPQGENYTLAPREDCLFISKALSLSRTKSAFTDCPSTVGNDIMVTMTRILEYFSKKKLDYKDSGSCYMRTVFPFASYNLEEGNTEAWNNFICYDDKIKTKEVCIPTLFSNYKNHKLSLSQTVGKMLARLKGFDNKNQSCKIINESAYKPKRLKFQTGCFILIKKGCKGTDCDIRIISSLNEFKDFKIKSKNTVDLFPYKFTTENKSQLKVFAKLYKKEIRVIKNISTLKRVFEKHPKAILVGTSCLEGLLPAHFKLSSFGACTPMPFIVDGMLEDNNTYSLITRTSIDHTHAPRIIPWSYVFSSLKFYQKSHPINLWSLYAIY